MATGTPVARILSKYEGPLLARRNTSVAMAAVSVAPSLAASALSSIKTLRPRSWISSLNAPSLDLIKSAPNCTGRSMPYISLMTVHSDLVVAGSSDTSQSQHCNFVEPLPMSNAARLIILTSRESIARTAIELYTPQQNCFIRNKAVSVRWEKRVEGVRVWSPVCSFSNCLSLVFVVVRQEGRFNRSKTVKNI